MPVRFVELFAGVGGFRLGLEGPPGLAEDPAYRVIWSNQWEPTTKVQHASDVYVKRWNLKETDDPVVFSDEEGAELHVNDDIGKVEAADVPDHELLTGGFPCQDYSVARTASQATGLEGKKGVLWWEILRILREKRPPLVLLENVDRLLKSPTSQRGRDFAIMLASLNELGYIVEWRVINSGEYGMPQRRRRVFIVAYGPDTPAHAELSSESDILGWIQSTGTLARAFPIQGLQVLLAIPMLIKGRPAADLADVSREFNAGAKPTDKSPFKDAGVLVGNNCYTYKTKSNYDGPQTTLGEILLNPSKVSVEFCIEAADILRAKGWKYQKGGKKEERKGTDGFVYTYNEGPLSFPDPLDKPSRTIVTGEGGKTASRFKHVVRFRPTKRMRQLFDLDGEEAQRVRDEISLRKNEWLRRLTPVELERLNMFPDDHTEGPGDGRRAFFMGNALVVGVIERIGVELLSQLGVERASIAEHA